MYRVKFEETVVSIKSSACQCRSYLCRKWMKYKKKIYKKVLWDGRGHSTGSEAECRCSSFQVRCVDFHLSL